MKTQLTVLAAVVVIFVCTGIAIVVSNDHRSHAAVSVSPQVQSLQKQLKTAQDVQKQHDAVATANTKNYGDQIINLTNQKTALCTQIKAAKLVQPICQ